MPGAPEAAVTAPPAPRGDNDTTPQTGDLVVDAVLDDLAGVDEADLDAVLAAGDAVHATLTARLSDLGS